MGSKQPSVSIVQPPPPQVTERPLQPLPAQTTQETARQVAQSRLEFDPQLAAQQFELLQRYYQPTAALQAQTQRQLAPQQAQAEYELARQYTPLYRSIYEQAFPEQTAGLRTLSAQSLQRFQAPDFLTPEQRAIQERGYEFGREQVRRNVREAANLGGTLYGGRRIEAETAALNRFEEAIAAQELERQRMNRAQALQELIASQQVIFPQIQQPGVPGGFVPQYQTAAPSPDALLQAAIAQSQGAIINPAQVIAGPSARSQNLQFAGQAAGAVGSAALAKSLMACLPGTSLIETEHSKKPIQDVGAGESIRGGIVLFKYEYAPMPTSFCRFTFEDGAWLEVCDKHLLDGRPAGRYTVGETIQSKRITQIDRSTRTEKTYDLLTAGEQGGYYCGGILVPSMIPALHRLSALLEEVMA